MFDMNVVIGLVIGALVASGIVYAITIRSRRGLEQRLSAAQSAQAVAESRVSDLTSTAAQLETENQQLTGDKLRLATERERLSTSLEKATQDLERESVAATGLREQLQEKSRLHSELESNHRVALTERANLAQRVTELEQKTKAGDEENRRQAAAIMDLNARATAVETERNGLLERLAAQEKWFTEQTRLFEEKVVNMTSTLLEEKSQKFTEVNRKEIDAVVAPFKEQLKEFRERVDHIYVADSRDRGQLHEQIRQLTELNQVVSKQAEDLTKALTISSKATGDWGEMILHKILEDSGLREGKEYVLQHTVEGADEDKQRPDAVVLLPDGKHVVVDAKVSSKAWKEYCAATDEETREARLDEHLGSVRAHMRELSTRDYQHSPDLKTIEFVLMFVPIEAALLTALSRDDSLFSDAWRAKVYLVSPGMLMASLKLIEGMWVYQRRKESADKIAEAGRKLYDKLTVFANTFEDVGSAIERAHGTFEKAKGQLATGKGNAIRLAERMKKLGVSPGAGKVMPAALIELADGVDDEAEVVALEAPEEEGPEEEEE